MRYIFISYSRKDTELADRLAAALRAEDFEISIDREKILGGEQWPEVLAEEIEASDAIVLMLSANSLTSRHVVKETHFAYEKEKLFFPIDLEKSLNLPKSISLPLAGVQRIDFAADFEDGLRLLLAALRNTRPTNRRKAVPGAQEAVDTLRAEIFNHSAYKEMQEKVAEIESDPRLSPNDRRFLAPMVSTAYLDKLSSYLIDQRVRLDKRSDDYISDDELRQLQYRREAIDSEIAKIRRRRQQKMDEIQASNEESKAELRALFKRQS